MLQRKINLKVLNHMESGWNDVGQKRREEKARTIGQRKRQKKQQQITVII